MRERYTLGVEEEYQLLDAETGELRSQAGDVLRTDWSDDLKGELHENTLEVDTPTCRGYDEVLAALSRRRAQAEATAAAEGLAIAAAGAHPVTSWHDQPIHQSARYKDIAEHHDRVARRVNIFGMHVHVGVPEEHDRARLMEALKPLSPHFVALAASSPFMDGEDTGFASYRGILWRLYPFMGPPPRFESQAEYDRFVESLVASGMIRDTGSIYWSLRPHSKYPTLEFRMMDTCPRLEDAAALAGLLRILVIAVAEKGLELPGPGGLSDDAWRAVLTENEWQAARYGLDAELMDPARPSGRRAVRDDLLDLLERAEPLADAIGEGEVPGRVRELMERGNAAERMRRIQRQTGSLEEVVAWTVRETRLGSGGDRRRWQRTEPESSGP